MPKFYSSNHIIKILKSKGFIFVSQKGSQMKFRKFNKNTLTVIAPADRKEIPEGTFRSILRQADLAEEDFRKK